MELPAETWLNLPEDLTNTSIPLEKRLKGFYFYEKIIKKKIDDDLKSIWDNFSWVKAKREHLASQHAKTLKEKRRIDRELKNIEKEYDLCK